MQAEQILGAECSQIHQDFVQCGRRILGVTLLVAVPAPCTAVSLEGGSGTSCLPWFFPVRSIWLCYGAGQSETSPANTFTVLQASTPSPSSSSKPEE